NNPSRCFEIIQHEFPFARSGDAKHNTLVSQPTKKPDERVRLSCYFNTVEPTRLSYRIQRRISRRASTRLGSWNTSVPTGKCHNHYRISRPQAMPRRT